MTIRVLLLLLLGMACGRSAVSQCEEAQQRSCTDIEGSCSAFFDAVRNVADKTDCNARADTYQSCVEAQADACTIDARCDAEEDALTNCSGAFCLTNASDPDCRYIADHL